MIWLQAGENVGPHSAEEERLMLLGTRGVEAATKSKMLYKTRDPRYIIDNQIHKEFDARKRWPQCKTIGEVHNEGNELLSWVNIRISMKESLYWNWNKRIFKIINIIILLLIVS